MQLITYLLLLGKSFSLVFDFANDTKMLLLITTCKILIYTIIVISYIKKRYNDTYRVSNMDVKIIFQCPIHRFIDVSMLSFLWSYITGVSKSSKFKIVKSNIYITICHKKFSRLDFDIKF